VDGNRPNVKLNSQAESFYNNLACPIDKQISAFFPYRREISGPKPPTGHLRISPVNGDGTFAAIVRP